MSDHSCIRYTRILLYFYIYIIFIVLEIILNNMAHMYILAMFKNIIYLFFFKRFSRFFTTVLRSSIFLYSPFYLYTFGLVPCDIKFVFGRPLPFSPSSFTRIYTLQFSYFHCPLHVDLLQYLNI